MMNNKQDDLPTLGKAAESFEREFSHPERVEIFNALLEHLDKPDTEDKQVSSVCKVSSVQVVNP